MASLAAILAFLFLAQDDAVERHATAAAEAMRTGDYQSAELHYRKLLKLGADLPEARMNLGLSCFLQKKYEVAITELEVSLKKKPDMINAWLFIGISQFHLNRPAQAIPALIRYTAVRPDDFQGAYFLGLSYLAVDDYLKAEERLLVARKLDPRNQDALYHLAQSYLGRARSNPAAADSTWPSYQSVVEQIAAIDDKSIRLGQLRAGYYEATGKKAEAIRELETLLADDPRVRGLHYALGCLYAEAVLYDKAIEQFTLELRLDSPHPRTYLQLAHAYIKLNRADTALPLLHQAAKFEPKDTGLVWVEIGRAYRSLNDAEKATAAFEKAIEFGERNSTVYYQLALSARRAGKLQLAQAAMEKSQALKRQEPASARQ